MRMFPSPSTSVFGPLLVTFLPLELPSAYDGGDGAASLNVVVIEGKIHVNDGKRHEEPQEQVVPEADLELAAHQGDDPGEHPGKPWEAHAGIQGKAGDGLE